MDEDDATSSFFPFHELNIEVSLLAFIERTLLSFSLFAGLMWSNSFPHRALPFATQHSFFLHGHNLVVVSREKRRDHAIGRIKRWTRRSSRSKTSRRGGEDEDDQEEEQTKVEL